MVVKRDPRNVLREVGKRTLAGFLFIAVGLVPLGCSERESTAPLGAPPIEWTATEDLRIGSVDDSASAMASVGSLAVDSDGRIYVSQPIDRTIRVFDAEGQRVGTFGGPGDGPGEFRQLSQIGIFADTLYASDRTAGRVTFFALDGQLLGTLPLVPHGLGPDWVPLAPMRVAPGGVALILPGFLGTQTRPDADYLFLFLHVDRSGQIADTAALVVRSPETWIRLRSPFGPMMLNQPFAAASVFVISADGLRLAVADAGGAAGRSRATFRVSVLGSIRDTIWSNSYAFEPTPIAPFMVDSSVSAMAGGLNREAFPDLAEAEGQIRQRLSLPDHLPPVSGGAFSDDGSLWLRREDIPGRDQRWTVLDSAGAPLARIMLPRTLRVEVVRSNMLWGVETDELGVPYVVRYRITR
jgi:hypothetical protein